MSIGGRRRSVAYPVLVRTGMIAMFCVVLFVFVRLTGLANLALFERPLVALYDLSARFHSIQTDPRAPPAMVVAIDDHTWREFVERSGRPPPATPASTIADIIDMARVAQAPLVVVDIDLTIDRSSVGEQSLERALSAWAQDSNAGALLLVHTCPLPRIDGICQKTTTPFDDEVASAPNIAWASTLVRQDADGVTRSIYAYDRASAASPPEPYIGLFAAEIWQGIVADGDGETAAVRARGRLQQVTECLVRGRGRCLKVIEGDPETTVPLPLSLRAPPPGALRDERSYASGALTAQSATEFLALKPIDDLTGTVLFVGVTHAGSSDRFKTPSGEMSGVFMVWSAASNWARGGVPRQQSWWTSLAIAFGWGAMVGLIVIGAAIIREAAMSKSLGPVSWWKTVLLHPRFTVPLAVLSINAVSFVALASFLRRPEDWAALTLAAFAVSVVLGLRDLTSHMSGRNS